MEVQGNGFANEMAIYFDGTAADSYESNRDATLLYAPSGSGVPNIYAIVDSTDLTINVMGQLNTDKMVQLGIKIQTPGSYNLVSTDMTSFPPSVLVI
jgi:hypothetical protein